MNLEIKNKVACGLRRMKIIPDFFIFLPQPDWTWDEKMILEIPVYHCSSLTIRFAPYADTDCPFLPCNFKETIDDSSFEFARGYYEG